MKFFDVASIGAGRPHMTGSKIIEVAKNYLPTVADSDIEHLDIEVNVYYEVKGTPQRHIFKYPNQAGSIVKFAKKIGAKLDMLSPIFGGVIGLSLTIEGGEQDEAITHQVMLHTNKHRIRDVARAMVILNYAVYELAEENMVENDTELLFS